MAAASAIRRLSATCGPVLLTQVLTRTTWFTIVAVSFRPTTITVSSVFQSAVSPETLSIIKNFPETALFGKFSSRFSLLGFLFQKKPQSVAPVRCIASQCSAVGARCSGEGIRSLARRGRAALTRGDGLSEILLFTMHFDLRERQEDFLAGESGDDLGEAGAAD